MRYRVGTGLDSVLSTGMYIGDSGLLFRPGGIVNM